MRETEHTTLDSEQLIEHMLELLRERDDIDHDELHQDADLLLDIGLDSIGIMQLLAALENRWQIVIPTRALNKNEYSTLANLAQAIGADQAQPERPQQTSTEGINEPELDIKVHCLVSCLCEPFRKNPDVDHRPFYFAVPDAEVFIDSDDRLTYHHPRVNHPFLIQAFENLYRVPVTPWFDPATTTDNNLRSLSQLLDSPKPDHTILVMLDMYQLPERENRFSQNPFPHYVMLEATEAADTLFMWDPDFRWEGPLNRQRVLNAVAQPCVNGGYLADYSQLRQPENEAIAAWFQMCFFPDDNPMTRKAREVIHRHQATNRLPQLPDALRQLPVLAIRKYGYEHGLAFFWRELKLVDAEFEHWCEDIEQLVRGYEKILYLATRYSQTPGTSTEQELMNQLDDQHRLEFGIKNALHQCFKHWCTVNGITTETPAMEGAA